MALHSYLEKHNVIFRNTLEESRRKAKDPIGTEKEVTALKGALKAAVDRKKVLLNS